MAIDSVCYSQVAKFQTGFHSTPPPTGGSTLLHVTLGYKGKPRFCPRCQQTHGGQCPELEAFNAARDLRKQQKISEMMLSDSTLRQADQTGLSTDVICMSGGRLGHLTHALQDAPQCKDVNQVIVVAVQNDIIRDGESLEVFTDIITQSLATMQQVWYHKPLTLVQPLVPQDSNPLRKQKAEFYHQLCTSQTIDTTSQLKYLPIDSSTIEMDGIHPTLDGTRQLLEAIDQHLSIITNNRFITDKKILPGQQLGFSIRLSILPPVQGLGSTFLLP